MSVEGLDGKTIYSGSTAKTVVVILKKGLDGEVLG